LPEVIRGNTASFRRKRQMTQDEVLRHEPAHRPVPGDFNVTAVTFAAMALFDRLDSGQRARAVVPMDDENRTHWNFLPESGRRGVPVRDRDREQRYLARRLIAQCMSVEGYAQVVLEWALDDMRNAGDDARVPRRRHAVPPGGRPCVEDRAARRLVRVDRGRAQHHDVEGFLRRSKP
jgi:uncharacterized protein (DUF2342 family)